MMVIISMQAAHFLPIYCAKMPNGTRIKAPESMGTETRKPRCIGVRPNSLLKNGPSAPSNTHIAKQKSKYKNDANNVGGCPDLRNVLKPAIMFLSFPLNQ